MKRFLMFSSLVFFVGLFLAGCQNPDTSVNPEAASSMAPLAKSGHNSACATIQSGTIYYSSGHYLSGQPIKTGFDVYGYNYEGHMFKGSYANAYLGAYGYPPYKGDDASYLTQNPTASSLWCWPYRDVKLEMKWSDAWISNTDCDGDGHLDRHYGYSSYIGSGAWLTNHMSGGTGKDHWTYFTKITAVPASAVNNGGTWYTSDGKEIGPVIWGEFATIQEVESGSGATFVSPAGPGFGKWK